MTEVLGVDWRNFDYMSVGVLLIDLKIIHYAGANKPWLEGAKPTALEGEWWRAARKSKVFDHFAHLAYREQAKVPPRRC